MAKRDIFFTTFFEKNFLSGLMSRLGLFQLIVIEARSKNPGLVVSNLLLRLAHLLDQIINSTKP